VRTGLRLAPTNPDANIAVAVLDARAGRWADAAERLRRTMEMSADHRQEVIDVVLGEFNRPQVALELAGKDRALLARVARTLDASADHADVAAEARARAERALLDEAAQPHATAATLAEAAQLALRTGDRATAIQFLRRATTIDYSALDLRLELARLFVEEGQPEQALREARNVLQQSPSNAAAKAMVAELQKPATRPVPTTLPTQPSTAPGTAPATQAGFKMT
jgi:tetratricopeptide (TPR) repeat protein